MQIMKSIFVQSHSVKGIDRNLILSCYLSDGHGAEDVEEDKGAVSVIFAQQVAMRQSLDIRKWHERQFGHDSSIKTEEKQQTDSTESFTAHFK